MTCAWKELLGILPSWLRSDVDRLGREDLQELRLRRGSTPELVLNRRTARLSRIITGEDLRLIINAASQYSPWAAATMAQGFLTAPGGHRIGICGEAVVKDGTMTGVRTANSLCIRVARDFPGLAARAAGLRGSILILGRPGSGKTTLLRDLIRQRGRQTNVAVVDERQELFPETQSGCCFDTGDRVDVLSGCGKGQGIDTVLRTMGPGCIALDEITSPQDCAALEAALWCGVDLLATAHAGSLEDLHRRPIYAPLVSSKLFDTVLIMNEDKSWRTERMYI